MADPTQSLPVPRHLSAQAQACLSAPLLADLPYPALDDRDGWRQRIAAMEQVILPAMLAGSDERGCTVSEKLVDGLRIFIVTPDGPAGHSRGVILDIHGGALILGGGAACRATACQLAQRLQKRVWSVDYRMPPDHPYPAPLDDCLNAYRALLRECPAQEIFVAGMSAGGNLAAALVLRARDEGLALPAGALLMTPEVDLTESGDSFATHRSIDTVPPSLMQVNQLYADGHDLSHPYLSPLFADFGQTNHGRGFVPTIVTSGTRDLFLSNAVRLHRALRAADIPAQLHLLEASGHVQFPGSPEAAELDRELRLFIAQQLAAPS